VCCLRPRVPGVSENITVRSIVGRLLEHSRIFRFQNGGKVEVYLASADWMPRNFFRRVEACFPIEDSVLRAQIENILETYWKDNVKSRERNSEPTYARRPIETDRIDAQAYFLEQAMKRKRTDVEIKPLVIKSNMQSSQKAREPAQRVAEPT
jgi:polyphosphate kinase